MDLSEAIRHVRAAALPPNTINEEDRKEMLKACEALRVSLESPMELAMRILFSVVPFIARRSRSSGLTTHLAASSDCPSTRP